MNLSSTWAQGMEREQICLLQTLKKKNCPTPKTNFSIPPFFIFLLKTVWCLLSAQLKASSHSFWFSEENKKLSEFKFKAGIH